MPTLTSPSRSLFRMEGVPLLVPSQKGPTTRRPALPVRGLEGQCAFSKLTTRSLARSHAELTGTLLAYALCLANQASSLVASLGSYEISNSVSSAAIAAHDETINSAAETLCRASGVLMFLAETVVPRWEAAVGTEALRSRPVEMTRQVTTALAK